MPDFHITVHRSTNSIALLACLNVFPNALLAMKFHSPFTAALRWNIKPTKVQKSQYIGTWYINDFHY